MKLEDDGGITSLPNTEIFEQLALTGYATDSDKLTFQKGDFSPQWRFFIHTILHCLIPKKTSWEQFSSNIATSIICLPTNRTFNFSKFIFDAMVKNLDNPHKFLMYPRFIQICLNKQRRLLQLHIRIYPTPVLTQKVFSNMKRVTRVSAPSTSPPPIPETTPTAQEPALMPNEFNSLTSQQSEEVSEASQESNTARRETKIVLLEDEVVEEDSSKQGRSLIEKLDMDADFSLVPPHDAEIQEKISNDTEVLLEEEETTELIEEPTELGRFKDRGEIREKEVTKCGLLHLILFVYHLVLIGETQHPPITLLSTTPHTAKLLRSRLGYEEAIRLQEQIDEEERKRIARDAEITKQLQEEYDKVGKKEVVTEVDIAHVIDWDDPAVIRYHALQNRPRFVAEVRKNMMVYLKNQGGYKMKDFKVMSYDDIRPIFEKLNQMVIIVPDEGINVEALQTKYPIIRWEVHSNDTMQFWKIIRVSNHTEVYQVFEDMLKNFDRDGLIKLWSLVQERYNSTGLTEDKEIELWVELKMLFEPNAENLLELQKYCLFL
ncbi:hypothetical protein Tco_0843358 [Tanacetum coccineum]|uniref:Uncharacterized protein n=1 Tax=Tanacetum coccineum TaxID=301880 RepID=A0ABQ5B5Z7_9ASTR